MTTLQETIRSDMTTAWKGGDTERRDALRLLLAAFKNAEIDFGHVLTDDETLRILQKEAKQRRDSITEYAKAARADLVAKEQVELDIIVEYLPSQLSDEDLRAIVRTVIHEVGAAGPSDVGKVMRPLLERVAGQADGSRVNQVVREILAG